MALQQAALLPRQPPLAVKQLLLPRQPPSAVMQSQPALVRAVAAAANTGRRRQHARQRLCQGWCSSSWPWCGLILLLCLNTGRRRQHARRRLHQLGSRQCSWLWCLQAVAGACSISTPPKAGRCWCPTLSICQPGPLSCQARLAWQTGVSSSCVAAAFKHSSLAPACTTSPAGSKTTHRWAYLMQVGAQQGQEPGPLWPCLDGAGGLHQRRGGPAVWLRHHRGWQ